MRCDGGQADAGAGEVLGRVQPLEGAEELVGVGHVEARAVVAHEVDALARRSVPRRTRSARSSLLRR